MDTQILHWNIRGLLHNLDDAKELLCKLNPKVLCVQETYLKPTQTGFLPQFAIFRKDRDDANTSSGGVAIIVDKSVACRALDLRTPLEAVAIRALLLGKLVTICSLYIPPNYRLQRTELEGLIDALPHPYILVGDFNAHNTLWGDSRCDSRGRIIEQILLSSGACVLNRKQPTYYSIAHNTYSSIDLSVASPTLVPLLEWNVIMNPYGSDHFPVCLKSTREHHPPPHAPRWKIASADWEKFKTMTHMPRNALSDFNIDDAVAYFTAFIIDCALECIPQTNGAPKKR